MFFVFDKYITHFIVYTPTQEIGAYSRLAKLYTWSTVVRPTPLPLCSRQDFINK